MIERAQGDFHVGQMALLLHDDVRLAFALVFQYFGNFG